jgi:hypothetical protein
MQEYKNVRVIRHRRKELHRRLVQVTSSKRKKERNKKVNKKINK